MPRVRIQYADFPYATLLDEARGYAPWRPDAVMGTRETARIRSTGDAVTPPLVGPPYTAVPGAACRSLLPVAQGDRAQGLVPSRHVDVLHRGVRSAALSVRSCQRHAAREAAGNMNRTGRRVTTHNGCNAPLPACGQHCERSVAWRFRAGCIHLAWRTTALPSGSPGSQYAYPRTLLHVGLQGCHLNRC